MPTHLSDEWFDEAARLLGGDPAQGIGGDTGDRFVVQQVVEDDAGTGPAVTWHVVVGPAGARLVRGAHPAPDVVFTCDRATAWAVHQGQLSAQGAFMAGRLRLGGDASALLAHHEALAGVTDSLAPLRAATTP